MKSKYIIPIFVPHRGCNNQCVFCNQRKISGQIKDLTAKEVKDIIDNYLSINNEVNYTNIQVAFYGGSFTGIEKEKQIEFLKIAKQYIDDKKIDSVRLSTRPDYIDEDILSYLKEYGVKTIELGVQSLNEKVLIASKRGHNSEVVEKSAILIKENGFELGLQMMLGLPSSNKEFEIETANRIIQLKPNIVRIYPTLVIKDTQLEEMYNQGVYVPYTIEEAVDICAEILPKFEENNITVIRIGLQATDNINDGKDVVAGPFHPAFGEMVRQRIFRNQIEERIKELNSNCIMVKCNRKDVSKVLGNRRSNYIYIKEKYGVELKVIEDNCIKVGFLKIFC